MLRTDLVPSRHLRNNRSRAIRLRDNPALLFLGPATPAANTSPDFNTPKRPPRIVKYIVDHICEPISPNRSTSDKLSAPPQGAVKTPLSVLFLDYFIYAIFEGIKGPKIVKDPLSNPIGSFGMESVRHIVLVARNCSLERHLSDRIWIGYSYPTRYQLPLFCDGVGVYFASAS